MNVISLQSGSNGNAIYVEAGETRLLFDAGISGKQAKLRLENHRRNICDVDGVFITHDHRDHVSCAGIYQRKFGLPMYITPQTLAQSQNNHNLGKLGQVEHFEAGETVRIKDVEIHSVSTRHDAVDGVGFVVEHEGKRLGILTDLGHVFDGLGELISTLDAVVLESNFDPGMLSDCDYPYFVKSRISGDGGHISNEESAVLVNEFGKNLKWACLAHLSENANNQYVAIETYRNVLERYLHLHVASRYEVGELLRI